jgi:hypothetical protein
MVLKLYAPKSQTYVSKPEGSTQKLVAAVRMCLRCGAGFDSQWSGNRICLDCTRGRRRVVKGWK